MIEPTPTPRGGPRGRSGRIIFWLVFLAVLAGAALLIARYYESLASLRFMARKGVQMVLAFSVLVFVHEFGHFILAKINGVRVEVFSIGFGPFILSWGRGETVYALSLIPFGGYVRMTGQEDLAITEKTSDPKHYLNKSPARRMTIIMAGVVMNVIFAFLILVAAFRYGVYFPSAKVGEIAEHDLLKDLKPVGAGPFSPADSGLQEGDRILSVDGVSLNVPNLPGKHASRQTMLRMAALGLPSDRKNVRLTLLRDEGTPQERQLEYDVPIQRQMGVPMPSVPTYVERKQHIRRFGVELWEKSPGKTDDEKGLGLLVENDPEDLRRLLKDGTQPPSTLKKGDVILSIAGTPVSRRADWLETVLDGKVAPDQYTVPAMVFRSGTVVAVEIDHLYNDYQFGIGLSPEGDGRIKYVARESRVWKQLETGDRILEIDGKPFAELGAATGATNPGQAMFLALQTAAREAGTKGRMTGTETTVSITFQKAGAEKPETRAFVPKRVKVIRLPRVAHVQVIKDVLPGGLADRAGIRPLDILRDVEFDVDTDSYYLGLLRGGHTERVHIAPPPAGAGGEGDPVSLGPIEHKDKWQAENLGRAVVMAAEEFGFMMRVTVLSLGALVTGHVSMDALAGPIMIFYSTYTTASMGIGYYVWFVAFISLSLAVFNVLPLPVLDGGHMVFLAYEWIRGRPAAAKVQETALYFGLMLILMLLVFVFYGDIAKLLRLW